MDEELYDTIFMCIADHAQSPDNFLEACFSFISRKTDCFKYPSLVENIVHQKYHRHLDLYREVDLKQRVCPIQFSKQRYNYQGHKRPKVAQDSELEVSAIETSMELE